MDVVVTIVLGLGLITSAVKAVPTLVVEWARHATPEVFFYADPVDPVIALTIDDGPSTATPEILDVLDEYGVRATFFVIGDHVQEMPELARELVDNGHELGHHMMTDEPSKDLAPKVFDAHLAQMDSILDDLGGSQIFRPGSGWYDDRMIEQAASLGYRTVLGSVYPFDAQVSSSSLASWYVSSLAGRGSVIVLHDGPERGLRTADVLRTILPDLMSRGYRVVPVSELIEHPSRQ